MTNAKIYYNGTFPPSIITVTEANVTKTETETMWSFDVLVEETYEDCFVYAAIYDTDGILIEVSQVPLNILGSTSVYVNKSDNDHSAKIFVWKDTMQPVTYAKEIEL